jgi:hypothetical protein
MAALRRMAVTAFQSVKVVATGLEPVTSTMSTWRSNQTELSDRRLT